MKPTCYVSEHKELEQRVAELEAELAAVRLYGDADVVAYKWQQTAIECDRVLKETDRQRDIWKARVEKAENFVRELKAEVNDVTIERNEARARAEKAESLVIDAKKVLVNLRSQVLVLMSEKRRAEARVAQLEDGVRVLRLKVGVRAQMVDALASRGKREG